MIKFGMMTDKSEGFYRRKDCRCRGCGQYINAGETYGHLVINGLHDETGKQVTDVLLDKTGEQHNNTFIHEKCFNSIPQDGYIEKIIYLYSQHWLNPKDSKYASIDQDVIDELKIKLNDKGYKITKETKGKIYFESGSVKYVYDKIMKNVEITNVRDPIVNIILKKAFYETFYETIYE